MKWKPFSLRWRNQNEDSKAEPKAGGKKSRIPNEFEDINSDPDPGTESQNFGKFSDSGKDQKNDPNLPFGTRLLQGFVSFSQWLQVKTGPILRKLDWDLIRTSSLILALTFVVASSVSTFAANFALTLVTSNKPGSPGEALIVDNASADVSSSKDSPVSAVRKSILERNVFNHEGTLAPEAEIADKKFIKTANLDFEKVPCTEEKLPVELLGTIFTGDPKRSFVTFKDPKIQDADIYKSGDVIIEHEDYEIHKVYRGSVELRKGDNKICLNVKGFANTNAVAAPAGVPTPFAAGPESIETFDFDSQYVQDQIGPGMSKILNDAKLIPEVEGGKTAGFKILAINPGSLFDRIKLQNGDLIADVNGVSLRDASQGFKLYEALQQEREVTIGIIRNGQPLTRKVRIK